MKILKIFGIQPSYDLASDSILDRKYLDLVNWMIKFTGAESDLLETKIETKNFKLWWITYKLLVNYGFSVIEINRKPLS